MSAAASVFSSFMGYIFVTRELGAEIIEAGLQMSYNLCNLPKQITAANGTSVKYSYFADGTKFKAVNAAGNGFAYTGSLRWSVQNGLLTPEGVAITGGRALYNDVEEPWSVNYYITDHLGSVRAVTDAEGEVLDTFDYMPYGSELTVDADNITDYRFTCKEKQLMFGNSNIYDSFARFQNTYGRFMSIDPKAESFYHISPYTYCAGDPVNLVDPDGRDWYQSNSNSGNPEYHYVQGVLSEEEMQNNGYIHLGHTYHFQNTYYSLFGGIFHSDNRIDKWRYKAIKMADQTIINMFYDPNHDFWNSLNNTISSGTSIADFIAEYKDVSSSTKKIINWASSITLVYKYCDIAINNDFADYYKKPEHILDLAIDIISYTRPEAAILGMIMSYTSEKGTKFILELETELQRKVDGLYYEMINLMNGGF